MVAHKTLSIYQIGRGLLPICKAQKIKRNAREKDFQGPPHMLIIKMKKIFL